MTLQGSFLTQSNIDTKTWETVSANRPYMCSTICRENANVLRRTVMRSRHAQPHAPLRHLLTTLQECVRSKRLLALNTYSDCALLRPMVELISDPIEFKSIHTAFWMIIFHSTMPFPQTKRHQRFAILSLFPRHMF